MCYMSALFLWDIQKLFMPNLTGPIYPYIRHVFETDIQYLYPQTIHSESEKNIVAETVSLTIYNAQPFWI